MPAKIKFSDEQRVAIVARYVAGESLTVLANNHGCYTRPIRNMLASAGVVIRPMSAADGNEANIVKRYEAGESIESLGRNYSVDPRKIRQVLRDAGIIQRTMAQANRRRSLDESFFDVIDTEAKAYFLGWLYADGCVTVEGRFIIILQARDAPILEEFRRQLGYGGEVRMNLKLNRVTLSVGSKHMVEQLINHGCTPNKTFTLTFPDWMPDRLLPHFIRGFIDGDGCYYSRGRNAYVSAVGTRAMCTRLFEVLAEKCGVTYSVVKLHGKDNGIVTARTGGAGQVRRVVDYLHKDATLYLERKKIKADSIAPLPLVGGENCHLTKLTAGAVAGIRARLAKGEFTGAIAADFGVSKSAIEHIKYGRSWKNG